jgi:tRNA pseudouridine55 synthase
MASGILIVDKPVGPTSFDVIFKLRRVLQQRDLGHCGTLDPLASGVLVVVVGEATKLVQWLTADDKRYVADIALGEGTPTDDRESAPSSTAAPADVDALTVAGVETALQRFVGNLQQLPPTHSAVQQDGERLYAKARRGEVVELRPRDVIGHAMHLRQLGVRDGASRIATVEVHCGKGFFIRSLARDLGAALGVPAHLASLRRVQSGAYDIAEATPLAALLEGGVPAQLLPIAHGVRGIARIEVSDDQALALWRGQRVAAEVAQSPPTLAVCGDTPVAMIEARAGAWRILRGMTPTLDPRGPAAAARAHEHP